MRLQVERSSLFTFMFRPWTRAYKKENSNNGRTSPLRFLIKACSVGSVFKWTEPNYCRKSLSADTSDSWNGLEVTTHFCGFVSSFECLQHTCGLFLAKIGQRNKEHRTCRHSVQGTTPHPLKHLSYATFSNLFLSPTIIHLPI